MCDCAIIIVKKENKKTQKKKFRLVEPNPVTLTSNSRNPLGTLPDDFASNPRKYRKPDSEISR